MRSFILLALIATAFAQQTAYFCEVSVPNFCSGTPCSDEPTLGSGILYARGAGTYRFENFNIISFKNFNGASDTEGRVAASGDVSLAAGYSIGDKIWTVGPGATDSHLPYSLIVGGKLTWPSGALYPQASNNPFMATQEKMYVSGTVTAADYLKSLNTADADLSSSLQSSFASAHLYYNDLQMAFASVSDNVVYSVASNGDLNLVCSGNQPAYTVSIPDSQFNKVRTYYFSSSCSPNSQFVFNINGTGTVTFQGNNIPESRRAETILFNIVGSGRTITVTGASVRGNILAPNNYMNTVNGGYIQGFQVYGDVINSRQINRVNCQPPSPPPHPPTITKLCPGFETDCAGLDITLPSPAPSTLFSFRDCNVISFQDFKANTGDVEGRVCVARDFIAGAGYSIGYELSTYNNLPDRSVPVSLLAGRNCIWTSGSLHPDGTNSPYPGAKENAFCGAGFNGSTDLAIRAPYSCGSAGCLDSIFNAAETCYNGYSTSLAAQADNVDVRVQWSALFLTCKDKSATQYTFSITPETMNQYTYIITDNCNFQAYWVMNIRGTSDITFTGAFIPVPDGAVVVNVIGSRTIHVTGIRLNAHLLAPQATINQTGGVIVGKVVAKNIVMALQINHQNTCPDLTTVEIPIIPHPPNVPNTPVIPGTSSSSSSGSSSSGSSSSSGTVPSSSSSSSSSSSTSSTSGVVPPTVPPTKPGCMPIYARGSIQNGDVISFTNDNGVTQGTVISTTETDICMDPPTSVPPIIYARVIGYANVRSNSGRRSVANPPENNSASFVGFSFALIFALAMLI